MSTLIAMEKVLRGSTQESALADIQARLEGLTPCPGLRGLLARLEVLDRLDACLAWAPEGVRRRVEVVRVELEAEMAAVYEGMRGEIRRGLMPAALMGWADTAWVEAAKGDGYDSLDELVGGVLRFEEPDDAHLERRAEQSFYQPTPVRHIFRLMSLTAPTGRDVLVDLGSGLGHIPLLINLCTAARGVGVELEETYVERARQCALGLKLDRVTFVREDARTADLSVGTIFYLYTPFRGSILRTVLDRLRGEAARRFIRVCTYGPCTAVVAEEGWLFARTPVEDDSIAVFGSCDPVESRSDRRPETTLLCRRHSLGG